MMLKDKKIGILLESDFYEHEIWYYISRFQEEGADLHFLTRLWGNNKLEFKGHEYHIPKECYESFEGMSDEELAKYSAIIVPSGMVADRLRYTEDVNKIPPATQFLARAFANKQIIKGIICHGLWLCAPMPELVKGRRLTVHNNLIGDARAYGAIYVNENLVVDEDLVTARAGDYCNLLAPKIIEIIGQKEKIGG